MRAGQAALLALAVTFTWNQWHHQYSSQIVETGFSVLLFGWAVLVFIYGQTDRTENIG